MHFGHSFKKTFLQALPSQHTFSARSGKPSPLKKNKKSRAHPGNADLFFVTESDSVHLRKAACTLSHVFFLFFLFASSHTSRFLSLFFLLPTPHSPKPRLSSTWFLLSCPRRRKITSKSKSKSKSAQNRALFLAHFFNNTPFQLVKRVSSKITSYPEVFLFRSPKMHFVLVGSSQSFFSSFLV